MVASVPELTNLTISTDAMAEHIIWARVFSSSVGAPKLVPFSTARFRAATTVG
jgi:hypothetical protein